MYDVREMAETVQQRPILPNSGCCVPAYSCAGLDAANGGGDRQFNVVHI
jgi:hypothetical protein